jgi:chromosome segregation ATPase
MDRELIAYLDERFRENASQIEGVLRQEVGGLRADLAAFRQEVDQRFEQVDQRFEQVDRRFEQVYQRFEQVDEQIRQVYVVMEGLRHEVHLVAEGYLGLNERLTAQQSETLLKLDEVRASIVPYYQDLNRRVGQMEGVVERQSRDVMDVIRERFGKPRAES